MNFLSRVLSRSRGPQRVEKKVLTREVASASLTGVRQAWPTSVATGLTPQRLAGILRAANDGDLENYLILAEEIEERDPHYQSQMATRKRAVSAIEPIITAASEDAQDKKIADFVRQAINEIEELPDLLFDMLDALGKGFSACEIVWRTHSDVWVPEKIAYCDPRFFRFDRETGTELRLLDEADLIDGVEIDPFKYILHEPRLKSGKSFRGGLARLVAFSVLCKAYSVKDWIAFAECYGLPLRLGKYGPNATDEDVNTLFKAVAGIGTDAAAVLPMSMQIDFEQVANGPGNDIFEKFARWADEQISKAVLGQTMTSDDGSSKAQAEVHNDVRHDILAADARQLSTTLRRDLIQPLVILNFGEQKNYPTIELPVAEPEDITALVANIDRLAARGMTFKATEIRRKLRLSDPDQDDEIIGGQMPPYAPVKTAQNNIAMNREGSGEHADAINDIAETALEDWEEQFLPMIGPVLRMIQEAASYEDALARLPAVVPDMENRTMIKALMIAATKAGIEGEAE